MYNILEPCPKFVGGAAIDDRLGGQGELLAGIVNDFYGKVTERIYKQAEQLAKVAKELNRRLNKRLKQQDDLVRMVATALRDAIALAQTENYAKLSHVAQTLATIDDALGDAEAPGATDFTAIPAAAPTPVMDTREEVAAPPLLAPPAAPAVPPAACEPTGRLSAAVELRDALQASRSVLEEGEIAEIITDSLGTPAQSPQQRMWRNASTGGRWLSDLLDGIAEAINTPIPGTPALPPLTEIFAPPPQPHGQPGPVPPSLAAAPASTCDRPGGRITLGSY